jgi:hypothetical protein
MPSPLRDGGVYHPDPSLPGVLLISTSPSGGGILTACPSATPLGLALGYKEVQSFSPTGLLPSVAAFPTAFD